MFESKSSDVYFSVSVMRIGAQDFTKFEVAAQSKQATAVVLFNCGDNYVEIELEHYDPVWIHYFACHPYERDRETGEWLRFCEACLDVIDTRELASEPVESILACLEAKLAELQF